MIILIIGIISLFFSILMFIFSICTLNEQAMPAMSVCVLFLICAAICFK